MTRIAEGPPIIHGPYEAARLNGRPGAAVLSNGGRRVVAAPVPENVAALLAHRLNERDAYHHALATIAEAGTFDPESFARAVLDGTPYEEALAEDHVALADDDEGQCPGAAAAETLSAARDAVVGAALAGDAATLESAVLGLRITLALMGR